MKKAIVLFTGAVIVISGISLIGANASENNATPIETGATIGVGAGVASTTEAPATTEAPSTTSAPVTSAPTTAPAVMTDIEKNMAWWTDGGEALVTQTSDLIGRFTEAGVAEQIMVSATAMAASVPDTEMGRHLAAAGTAYAQGAAAYSDAFAGDVDHLNDGLDAAIEFLTLGNAEMDLATAAISG